MQRAARSPALPLGIGYPWCSGWRRFSSSYKREKGSSSSFWVIWDLWRQTNAFLFIHIIHSFVFFSKIPSLPISFKVTVGFCFALGEQFETAQPSLDPSALQDSWGIVTRAPSLSAVCYLSFGLKFRLAEEYPPAALVMQWKLGSTTVEQQWTPGPQQE